MRCVRTRVFPEPAPAKTRSGPVWCVTASNCDWLRPLVQLCEGTPIDYMEGGLIEALYYFPAIFLLRIKKKISWRLKWFKAKIKN